jgi:hypothetical protein
MSRLQVVLPASLDENTSLKQRSEVGQPGLRVLLSSCG